jgi:hypothetical protein
MQFLCKITRYDMIPRLNLNRNVIATLRISGGSGWRTDLDLHLRKMFYVMTVMTQIGWLNGQV